MSCPKFEHSAMPISSKAFIVAGGYHKRKKFSNTCEQYSISTEIWEPLPSLNINRERPGIVLMKNRYLYIIGGNIEGTAIELLDLCKKEIWETLTIIENKISCKKVLCFQGSYNEFIILCDDLSSSQIIFNIDKNTIQKSDKMEKLNGVLILMIPCCFPAQGFIAVSKCSPLIAMLT